MSENFKSTEILNKLRELAEQLEHPEVGLATIFNNLPDLICVASEEYFLAVNRAWERTTGFTLQELKQRPWKIFLHPDDLTATLKITDEMKITNIFNFINRHQHKQGGYRWLYWHALKWNEKGLTYACARDITQDPLFSGILKTLAEERATNYGK